MSRQHQRRIALITGATGFLGRAVLKAFDAADGWDAVGTGFSRAKPPQIRKVDIQNANEVTALLDEVRPQVVVHCAADRKPESCTANPDNARRLNVTATSLLATECASRGVFLVYISTDYVFAGRPGEAPYTSASRPDPVNTYGQTKFEGETAVLSVTATAASSSGAGGGENNDKKEGVVLRVPVLYGETSPHDNNAESAVNVLMDALQKSQTATVKMDDWAARYPTNTADVGRVCVDLARVYLSSSSSSSSSEKDEQKPKPRILAFTSEDRMTKYDICHKFGEIMNVPVDGIVRDPDAGKPSADGTLRPFDCHLSTKELKELGIDVLTVDFVIWWRRYVGAFRH